MSTASSSTARGDSNPTADTNHTDKALADPAAPSCTVYFDGSCPLCQREINLYQTMAGSQAIIWHDVSTAPPDSPDLSQNDAMARFHMRRADGKLVSGAQGFFEVMKALPKLRWLGTLLSIPPLPWMAEGAYRLFLPMRPTLKRWVPAPKTKPHSDV